MGCAVVVKFECAVQGRGVMRGQRYDNNGMQGNAVLLKSVGRSWNADK